MTSASPEAPFAARDRSGPRAIQTSPDSRHKTGLPNGLIPRDQREAEGQSGRHNGSIPGIFELISGDRCRGISNAYRDWFEGDGGRRVQSRPDGSELVCGYRLGGLRHLPEVDQGCHRYDKTIGGLGFSQGPCS